MQLTPVIKNDNNRRKLPQTTNMEIAPNTIHLDMSSVQHGTLSSTSVVTLDTGSQCAQKVPLSQTEWEKSTLQER